MLLVERIRAATPKTKARLTGAVYLAYFLAAIAGTTLVSYDVPALAFNLLSTALYALLTVMFYFMFRPVNKWVSLLAALISFAGCIFTVIQLMHPTRYVVSPLIFFGFYCLLIGQLIVRSGFLPKILGALLVVAGVGWLLFLFPFAKPLNTVTEIFGVLAEGALCLWLLIAGVRSGRAKGQSARKVTG
jgi:Domain of unknown function (DUF4386)